MSVINQMLRDLDRRGQPPQVPAQGTHSVAAPARSVRAPHANRRKPWAWWVGAGGLGAAVALVGAWHVGERVLQGVPERPAPAVLASAPVLPASLPVQPGSEVVSSAAVPDLPVSLRLEAQLEHVPAPAPVAMVKQNTAVASGRSESLSPRPQTAERPLPPAATLEKPQPSLAAPTPAPVPETAVAKTLPTVPDTAQQAQRQGAAAREALAQAQSLWNTGNPAAATAMLRDAVQVVLRTTPATAPLDSTQVLMVRELARMQMGSGQVAEVHALLVQNEARFHANAGLWAMRANAAQRLGQHQDSVQSYMQALQISPNEQRWLLGMAVSLAAMGQTGAASGVVERARAQGTIPREIADYLRQLGVVTQ